MDFYPSPEKQAERKSEEIRSKFNQLVTDGIYCFGIDWVIDVVDELQESNSMYHTSGMAPPPYYIGGEDAELDGAINLTTKHPFDESKMDAEMTDEEWDNLFGFPSWQFYCDITEENVDRIMEDIFTVMWEDEYDSWKANHDGMTAKVSLLIEQPNKLGEQLYSTTTPQKAFTLPPLAERKNKYELHEFSIMAEITMGIVTTIENLRAQLGRDKLQLAGIHRDDGTGIIFYLGERGVKGLKIKKKLGRPGDKLQQAYENVPTTPVPLEEYATKMGVSTHVLRQAKERDTFKHKGRVKTKKDKATGVLMIWRDSPLPTVEMRVNE